MPTTIFQTLRHMALFQLGITVFGGLGIALFVDFRLGASFAAGAALMLFNLLALAWTSWRMLSKKPVASTVVVIVIKYALLLGSVFYLARMDGFSSLGAGLGLASLMVAILGSALITSKTSFDKERDTDRA